MNRYQLAVRTSNVTNGQAALEIIAPAVNPLGANAKLGCRVFGIRFTLATAVATVLGVGRPVAAGITPTTPVAIQAMEGADPAATKVALAWGTSPTAPANFLERWSSTATIGVGFSFAWSKGLWIAAGQTLTLHNITGGATLDATVEIEE